jgi:hypothetical protein
VISHLGCDSVSEQLQGDSNSSCTDPDVVVACRHAVACISYQKAGTAPVQEHLATTGWLQDAWACLQSVVIILTLLKWLDFAHAAPSFQLLTSAIGNVSIVVGEIFVIAGTFCMVLGTWLHSANLQLTYNIAMPHVPAST